MLSSLLAAIIYFKVSLSKIRSLAVWGVKTIGFGKELEDLLFVWHILFNNAYKANLFNIRVLSLSFFLSSVPSVFGNQEAQYLDVIKQMLSASLVDQTSFDVRFMAVKVS